MEQINTKYELKRMLAKYKNILSNPMFEYLNSLIELDFSVVRENIDNNDRKILEELEIYRKISTYNIFHRALNILDQANIPIDIYTHDNGYNIFNNGFDIFSFNSKNTLIEDKMTNNKEIELYQVIENKELRHNELKEMIETLKRLKSERNPYCSKRGIIGGIGTDWRSEQIQKIKYCDKKIEILKKKITKDDIKEIETTKKVFSLMIQDYGLTNESFEIDKTNIANNKNNMRKTLTKNIPHLKINNNIRYI